MSWRLRWYLRRAMPRGRGAMRARSSAPACSAADRGSSRSASLRAPTAVVSDPKRDAAIQFARKVIDTRGKVSDADLKAVRDAGYTDANVMEIVALVAMYSLTNFFNNVFDPEKDFPAVAPAGSI